MRVRLKKGEGAGGGGGGGREKKAKEKRGTKPDFLSALSVQKDRERNKR